MKLAQVVLKMLSEKTGRDVSTLSGADYLRNDIEASIGENLSLNTVKRLTGVLPYESEPRQSTLEIIAKYLGYESWKLFSDYINNKISEFNTANGFIELTTLPLGCEIIIAWQPDRRIHIRHVGNGNYIVVKSENSKLLEGDTLSLSQIAIGFPFIVKQVIREGRNLGNYTAASLEGLSSIKFI